MTNVITEQFKSNTFIIQDVYPYRYFLWQEWSIGMLLVGFDFKERLEQLGPRPNDLARLPTWITMT